MRRAAAIALTVLLIGPGVALLPDRHGRALPGARALPGGDGATESDAQPWVDVRGRGARGDGKTDDTASIQGAIRSLSGGGTVFFPRGIYRITDTLVLGGNVRVLGASSAASVEIRQAGRARTIFTQESGPRARGKVRIENLTLRLGDDAESHGIHLRQAFEFALENCQFIAEVSGATKGGDAIRLTDGCADGRVTGCVVGAGCGRGIFVDRSRQIIIAGNVIHENYGPGIEVARSASITIQGNTVTENNRQGIYLHDNDGSFTRADGISVVGNIARLNGQPLPDAGAHPASGIDVRVTRAAVTGNTVDFNHGNGILLQDASDCAVSGNLVNANGLAGSTSSDDGIRLHATALGTCKNNVVIGNRCLDSRLQRTQDRGINADGSGALGPNLIVYNSCDGNRSGAVATISAATIRAGNLGVRSEFPPAGGRVRAGPGTALVISPAGSVAVTGSHHRLDTHGGKALDSLVAITGGSAGDLLFLQVARDARTVVLRDGAPGGNLRLGRDRRALNATDDSILLLCTGPAWVEVSYSSNGD